MPAARSLPSRCPTCAPTLSTPQHPLLPQSYQEADWIHHLTWKRYIPEPRVRSKPHRGAPLRADLRRCVLTTRVYICLHADPQHHPAVAGARLPVEHVCVGSAGTLRHLCRGDSRAGFAVCVQRQLAGPLSCCSALQPKRAGKLAMACCAVASALQTADELVPLCFALQSHGAPRLSSHSQLVVPFSLLSFALSLLMLFRTNSCCERGRGMPCLRPAIPCPRHAQAISGRAMFRPATSLPRYLLRYCRNGLGCHAMAQMGGGGRPARCGAAHTSPAGPSCGW